MAYNYWGLASSHVYIVDSNLASVATSALDVCALWSKQVK